MKAVLAFFFTASVALAQFNPPPPSTTAVTQNASGVVVAPSTVAQTGSNKEVWIGIRTDGKAGDGSKLSPFDGSTQAKFDALMAGFPSWTHIRLLSGIYETKGADPTSTYGGFALKEGQWLQGAGRGLATIKFVGYGANITNIALGTDWRTEQDFVTVSDLTVDGNASAFTLNPANPALHGIAFGGSYSTCRNVEVMGTYASTSGPSNEGFSIHLGTVVLEVAGHTPLDSVGNVADDCYIHGIQGDFMQGINIHGSTASFAKTASGIIRNCLVEGNPWLAYEGANSDGVLLVNNQARNCGFGYRIDSGCAKNITITGNYFQIASSAFYNYDNCVAFVTNGDGDMENITITGNTLVGGSNSNGVILTSGPTGKTYSNVVVSGNNFFATDLTLPSYLANVSGDWKNVFVSGNSSTNGGVLLNAVDSTVTVGANNINGVLTSGSFQISNGSIGGTAQVSNLDMGLDFGTNSPGSAGNMKIHFFGNDYGFGISSGTVEMVGPQFSFYQNGTRYADMLGNGHLVLGSGSDDGANFLQSPGPIKIGSSAPSSSSASGIAGTITWDASFIYICTATNTWKRVAIATW